MNRWPRVSAGRAVATLRESQEFQSALVRLTAWLVMAVFIGIGGIQGHYTISWSLYAWLFGVHFVWFAGLLYDIVRRPWLRPWRTRFAIVADLSAITLLILLAGEPLAPFYLVYILSFLSQGTRYGRTNLTIASIGSVLAYGAIATVMGGWQTHGFEVGFILASLLILPLYQDRLLRNLQATRQRAEDANAARGDFLATVSHELRTPLAGMVGAARLLRDSDLDPEQQRCAESICASGDTLQALIGDILDLSKIDSGCLDLHPELFELRRSVLDVSRNVGQQALDNGVELICCIDGRLPVLAYGDRLRFEQILYNLIGNSVKFTPAGRIRIEVERSGPHPRLPEEHVEVVIADTGVGIPRARLDSIFDSFWQADTRASRGRGGTGLGTTIAHRLTTGMGGDISVDSEEGQGTTFRIRLPLLPGSAHDRPPEPPAVLQGRTALVYECDPEARSALEESLRQAGMQAVSCSDDMELERHLQEPGVSERIEVAIVADNPPGLDLGAVAERLRERIGHTVPTLYVGYGGRLANGSATTAVGKPWHPDEFWAALAAVVDREGAERGSAARAMLAGVRGVKPLSILVVEDDSVNAELAATVLGRLGYTVTVARNGRDALERLAAGGVQLVLVDLRMPGMDGVEFTQRLRAHERDGTRLPIVALSANAAVEVRARGLEAGMDGFLTKPLDPDKLESLIDRLVRA
ncbi:response regulator [Halofilum ochraceum]|uniref:response regulator n=1 Tax=Halofilum ochraceum TaxID=1611323 RepID=UPI001585DACE|nr:response regulator [Halofilum ochraceum]